MCAVVNAVNRGPCSAAPFSSRSESRSLAPPPPPAPLAPPPPPILRFLWYSLHPPLPYAVAWQVLSGNTLLSLPFDALFHLSLLTSLDLSNCHLTSLYALQLVSQVRTPSKECGCCLSAAFL